MSIKIDQPIVDQQVVSEDQDSYQYPVYQGPIERPESLNGKTYKIRPGSDAAAMYITVNYIKNSDGTYYPFEVFINSKNVSHFSWVVSLTRMISGIFRSGGDFLFVLDELKTVHDPSGPYIVKGSGFMPSVPAHIGKILEQSFEEFGIIGSHQPDVGQESSESVDIGSGEDNNEPVPGYTGVPCPSCGMPTLHISEGCKECLNADCNYNGCE